MCDFTGSYHNWAGKIDHIEGGGAMSHLRTRNDAGIRQVIDHRCFNVGEEYIVSGFFKLQNSTGHGAMCDPDGDQGLWKSSCPWIHLVAEECSTADGMAKVNMTTDQYKINGWSPDAYNYFVYELAVNADLASCQKAEIRIYHVAKEHDILVQSVDIRKKTKAPTSAPTVPVTSPPTGAPTSAPVAPTAAPTGRPTSQTMSLPAVGDSSFITDTSLPIAFAKADVRTLTTLTRVTVISDGNVTTETTVIPIARSYNGNDWEKEPGRIVEDTMYDRDWYCYSAACEFDLPVLALNDQYKLHTYEASEQYTNSSLNARDNVIARFLESATYGTTKAGINTIKGISTNSNRRRLAEDDQITSWVADQMNATITPPTSHREYWRTRANPRVRDLNIS